MAGNALWQVTIEDREHQKYITPSTLQLSPAYYSWHAKGGPELAEVRVTGTQQELNQIMTWMRFGIRIYNPHNQLVWWGMVQDIDLYVGSLRLGLSLDTLYNSVSVTYVNQSHRQTTAYYKDNLSVAALGEKQVMIPLGDLTQEAAEQHAQNVLDRVRFAGRRRDWGDASGDRYAVLFCTGWNRTLDWRYYARDEGLTEYRGTGNAQQGLGKGFVAVGNYSFEGNSGYLSHVGGKLTEFDKGEKVRITGTVSNNGLHDVERGTGQSPSSYTASTISFDNTESTATDTAKGFTDFSAHDLIQVTGGLNNGNYYIIKSVRDFGSVLELEGSSAPATEAAGTSISIAKGNTIQLETSLVTEIGTGATMSLEGQGREIAQSFVVGSSEAWTVDVVRLKLRSVGSPTDNVFVELRTDTSGNPGTVLETSALVGGADISKTFEWVDFQMANTTSLTPGVTYWIFLKRSTPQLPLDFYEVQLDEDLGYGPGSLQMWDGVAWGTRDPEADMIFSVVGSEATDQQIKTALEENAEFISGVSLFTTSGVSIPQFRQGDRTVLEEISTLLDIGKDGKRLLYRITPERRFQLLEEPAEPGSLSDTEYSWRDDGSVIGKYGRSLLLGDLSFVGNWMGLKDLHLGMADVSYIGRISPFFVERAEYDVESGRVSPEARDMPSPWDVGGLDL